MSVTRSVHVKAHLLNSVLKVRPRQGEVLKTTNDGAIEGSIGRRRALNGGYLGLRVDRRGSGLAVEHAGALQLLMRILLLRMVH
jgi:hypothetical protein